MSTGKWKRHQKPPVELICPNCKTTFLIPMWKYRFRIKHNKKTQFYCKKECHSQSMQKDPKKKSKSINRKKNTVQGLANKYARLRDCFGAEGTSCISCSKWFPFEKGDGGHFIPMGSSSALRYDERNINFQCHSCNRFQHGNAHNYYVGMVRKYGQEVVDELMSRQHETKKWTDDELEKVRTYYRDKIKSIELGNDPREPSNPGMAMSDLFSDLSETG